MQIDSVGSQSLYAIQPYMDREALPENPENSTPLPTDQGEAVNPINLLASNTTLNHLLGTDIQMVNLEKPEESERPSKLSEEKNRELMLEHYVFMAWHRAKQPGIQEAIRSGQYKSVSDENIVDLLKNLDTLLKGVELTKKESEALETFNLQASQLTDWLDASSTSNEEDLFRGLVESFGTLMNSLNDAMESTPDLRHDLKSLFRTGENQLRSALEDIVIVTQLTRNDVAERIYEFARSEKHKQSLQKLMPDIIEGLKEYMLSKDKDYGTKYL